MATRLPRPARVQIERTPRVGNGQYDAADLEQHVMQQQEIRNEQRDAMAREKDTLQENFQEGCIATDEAEIQRKFEEWLRQEESRGKRDVELSRFNEYQYGLTPNY